MGTTPDLAALPARDARSGLATAVVEAPRGSRVKFKYDPRLGLFRLDKVLPLGAAFPFDFGFVPSTRGGDGDPLDVLVLADEPSFPGCVVGVRLIGVITAEQTEGGETVRNDRLVGVVETRHNPPPVRSLDELPPGRVDEIEHFFVSYNRAEGREFKPLGRLGPAAADRLLGEAAERFRPPEKGPEPNPSRDGQADAGGLSGSGSGAKAVRRVVREQVGKARDALDGDEATDAAVHDARKRLKKARAGLRLLRTALGRRAYDRQNRRLRDAARPLTEVRDARVLLDTFDELAAQAGGRPDWQGIRQALADDYREARARVLGAGGPLGEVKEALDAARDWLKGRSVGRRGWSVLGEGLRRTYRAGRDALAAARQEPSVENLHEWRKQAKYLRHQLRMLRPMQPAVLGELADLAHGLADALGRDHDLAVLRTRLEGEPDRFPDRAAAADLLNLIARRRAELQREAFGLGERLYEEKPGVFADLLGDYWHGWRDGEQAEPGEEPAAEAAPR